MLTAVLVLMILTAAEMHLFKPDSSKTGYWRMDSLSDDGEVLKLKRKVN